MFSFEVFDYNTSKLSKDGSEATQQPKTTITTRKAVDRNIFNFKLNLQWIDID